MAKIFRVALFYFLIAFIGVITIITTQLLVSGDIRDLKGRFLAYAESVRAYVSGNDTELMSEASQPPDSPAPQAEETAASVPSPPDYTMAAATPPALSDSCTAGSAVPDAIVVGDRLKLRIFEQTILPRESGSRGAADEGRSVVFERLDLSGVYEVDPAGEVSMPMLGRIPVAGRGLACAESMVSVRYFDLTRAPALANAVFEQRLPVTIVGAVRSPGSYAYSPGLTAGVLLARAGLPSDGGVDIAARVAALKSRRNELEGQVLSAGIERRRLEASLDRRAGIGLSKEEAAAAAKRLGTLRIASETSALDSELETLRLQDQRDRAMLGDLQSRIEELQKQDAAVRSQLETLYKRRDDLNDFRERGFVLAAQVDSTVFNIMQSERFLAELQGKVLELRSERRRAELDGKLRETDRREALTRRIRDLAEEGNSLSDQLATVNADLAMLDDQSGGADGRSRLVLTVDRLGATGMVRVGLQPSGTLLPGDVVTVSIAQMPEKAASTDLSRPGPVLLPVSAPVTR